MNNPRNMYNGRPFLPNGTNGRGTHPNRTTLAAPSVNSNPLLASPFKELPVIGFINQHQGLRGEQPFRGVAVLALLHMYPNAFAVARTWIDFGCEPGDIFICHKSGYGYDADNTVKNALAQLGVNVVTVAAIDGNFLDSLEAQLTARDLRLIVCEDGGAAAPQILKRHSLLAKCAGFVEQTTKGLWRTKVVTARPAKPYLALPLSEFKRKFEPPHVAHAFVRTLDAMLVGYRRLRDMNIAVLGCGGCIGSHIADLLLNYTNHVTVFDKALPKLYRLLNRDFEIAESINEAVTGRDAVIGCTGSCVIGLNEFSRVKDGCVIASASSEQAEIDVQGLERLKETSEPFVTPGLNCRSTIFRLRPHGKRVVLLNNGYPLNFAHGGNLDPFPFDLVMALLLAGTVELALGTYDGRKGILDVFDEIDERYQLAETYLNIHRNR
jgi:S-adenosylhomocysteine hydrolase